MAVTAPARPPRAPEVEEPEQLEALIKEARRRARLRRLRYATLVVLAGSAGAAAVLGPGGGDGAGGPAVPEPVPADAEIKLAGPRLAYVPDPRFVLYVTKPDGSGARELTRCEPTPVCEIRNPVWSPDGRRIAFLRGRRAFVRGRPVRPSGRDDMALYVIRPDGRGERRLSDCSGFDGTCGAMLGSRLSWSPDGSQIAFSRGGVLSIVDVESARVRRLTACAPPFCTDISPVWAPDQTALAFTRFSRNDATGRGALFRVKVNGSQLTRLALEGLNPAWSPDSKTILIDTYGGIVSVVADGSETTLVALEARGNGPGVPSWSPDGSRVLYFWTPREPDGYVAEV